MHTFVLTMVLIGASESITTAQFSTIEQCSNAGNMFVKSIPTNMGHRAYWTCQQADNNPIEENVE